MPTIDRVQADHFIIPLPCVPEDAMHGQMKGFEVVTACITDSDGASGIGYTFTCGVNGGAIADTPGRETAPRITGRDPALIEAIWKDLWWQFHYGGRGGHLAACPNRSCLEAHGFRLENHIETPLRIEEGHGVRFDWDRLETLRA